MPVRNTACPHCGRETLVNVPDEDTKIQRVAQNDGWSGKDTHAACQHCGKKFSAKYTK
jgi:DNA-directed RNA polymerase subunit RPC12/RpoP